MPLKSTNGASAFCLGARNCVSRANGVVVSLSSAIGIGPERVGGGCDGGGGVGGGGGGGADGGGGGGLPLGPEPPEQALMNNNDARMRSVFLNTQRNTSARIGPTPIRHATENPLAEFHANANMCAPGKSRVMQLFLRRSRFFERKKMRSIAAKISIEIVGFISDFAIRKKRWAARPLNKIAMPAR